MICMYGRVWFWGVGETYGGTVDVSVVGVDNGGGEVDQGCAGVSNGDEGVIDAVKQESSQPTPWENRHTHIYKKGWRGCIQVITNTVASGGELPVTGQLGNGGVGQAVGEGVVNETEVVRAS